MLPPWLARPILDFAERRGWLDRAHLGMEIKTTSVIGYLRFWLLAKLRALAPRSLPLSGGAGADRSLARPDHAKRPTALADLALEVAECARLIKGYGDTTSAAPTNYRTIEARVIRPALAGRFRPRMPASTPSPAPAPRRWSIPKAKASRAASPTSTTANLRDGGGIASRANRLATQPNRGLGVELRGAALFRAYTRADEQRDEPAAKSDPHQERA